MHKIQTRLPETFNKHWHSFMIEHSATKKPAKFPLHKNSDMIGTFTAIAPKPRLSFI